ncbi:MAG: anthranilate phosphoribosyltransferase, partial [Betaproteobacteria bacterium HGW-Betaproteobacteria-21]
EITAAATVMRELATKVVVNPPHEHFLDVVGTGGDGTHTFNISTATMFVAAAAGARVAKHGNRGVSSKSGSADVLESLGVDVSLSPADMARCVDECGVGFLFAPALHASMRHAGPTRTEIGIRTVFNILGPLTNPAGASRQLLGVYDAALAPVIAEVAGRLGAERVLVVNGHPGMDEVSASGITTVSEYQRGIGVTTYTMTPEKIGIARGALADIAGGDAGENARIVRSVLSGEHGPRRDIVLMNSSAALVAAGVVADWAEGVVKARESLDSGKALSALDSLVAVSNRLAGKTAS